MRSETIITRIAIAIIAIISFGMAISAKGDNYYLMQNTNLPPFPVNPFTNLTVYSWSSNNFLIDDTEVDFSPRYVMTSDDLPPVPGGGDDSGTNGPGPVFNTPSYGSNDLYLTISLTNVISTNLNANTNIAVTTNSMALLTLHGTIASNLYQLESTAVLAESNTIWNPREIIAGANGTNISFFSLISATNPPNQFFRAHGATNVVFFTGDISNAHEPDSNGNGGFFGLAGIRITNIAGFGTQVANPTVNYAVGGTASNGVDYVFLPGVTNFTALPDGSIVVNPLFSREKDLDTDVVLTLLRGNGYLVDTNHATAVVIIGENSSSNSLFEFVTNLVSPVGMAYHPVSNCLVVSVNFDEGGSPNNFVRLFTNIVLTNISGTNVLVTNTVVENWSGISDLSEEIKLAIVPITTNGFTNGDMFFGTSTNGVIAMLTANGTRSNLDWLTLSEENILRGGLHIDETGIFNNNLIVVSGGDESHGGGVWQIDAAKHATILANFTNTHLEGVITVPNDTNKYGPWAGKILTGAEAAEPPTVLTIDTNGVTNTFLLNIQPEDFDIIPTNQDFYINAHFFAGVFKLPKEVLVPYVGDIIITQAGEVGSQATARLFIVHWDASSGTFLRRSIRTANSVAAGDFEHGAFAPINFPTSHLSNPEQP